MFKLAVVVSVLGIVVKNITVRVTFSLYFTHKHNDNKKYILITYVRKAKIFIPAERYITGRPLCLVITYKNIRTIPLIMHYTVIR